MTQTKKIKSITPIGRSKVYDISVRDAEHYILKNGVVTHNTGIYYSANTIWIVGRRQDKDGTEIKGYHFIINVEKSRFVKEKSVIPISVSWKGGIMQWSGLLDVALEGGYVVKPKNGWYQAINPETKAELSKSIRESATYTSDFWSEIMKKTDFAKYVENRFSVGTVNMLDDGKEIAAETEEELEEDEDDS